MIYHPKNLQNQLVGVILRAGGLGRPAYPIRARALCDPMPFAGLMYER